MPTRRTTWAITIWTVFMAVGILAAALGIGGDCAGLTGSELGACQSAAWIRGGIGLTLLFILWLVGLLPLAVLWLVSRPKENVVVFGPGGRQSTVSEREAEKRVDEQGWTYEKPA